MSELITDRPKLVSNNQAKASLILGITSIVLAFFILFENILGTLGYVSPVAAILALIAGARGINYARNQNGLGRDLAIGGLAVGVVGLILFGIVARIHLTPYVNESERQLTGAAANGAFNRGISYLEEDDLESAMSEFNKAIELDPGNFRGYAGRGDVFLLSGDYDAAIEEYNHAEEAGGEFAELYHSRGMAYRQKNDFDHAISDFDRAIEMNPDYADAYFHRGNAFLNKGIGRDDEKVILEWAIADWNEVLRITKDPLLLQLANNSIAVTEDYLETLGDSP